MTRNRPPLPRPGSPMANYIIGVDAILAKYARLGPVNTLGNENATLRSIGEQIWPEILTLCDESWPQKGDAITEIFVRVGKEKLISFLESKCMTREYHPLYGYRLPL